MMVAVGRWKPHHVPCASMLRCSQGSMASVSSFAIASVCGKSLPRCASINFFISFGRSSRAVLIGALFTEGGLVGDCVLQIRDFTFERRVSEHHLRERDRMICNLTGIGENHHVLQEVEVTAHERHHHVIGSHINRASIVHFECWIGQGFRKSLLPDLALCRSVG